MNIVGGRQSGRTTKLIELAAEAEANGEFCYIVCHSNSEAYRISRMAKQMEKAIQFPLTYDEFLQRQYHGAHIKKFFIDNADMLLQRLSPVVPIAAMTLYEDGEGVKS